MTSKTRQRKLERYVEKVKPLLGIQDWEVFIAQDAPTKKGVVANCSRMKHRKVGILRFGPQFWRMPQHERKETVIHELLHCVLAQVSDVVDFQAAELLEDPVADALWASHEMASEYAIDSLSVGLAKVFPDLPNL